MKITAVQNNSSQQGGLQSDPAQSRVSHRVRPGLRALSHGGWKPSKEGDGAISLGLSPIPGCPHKEKSFPLSLTPLAMHSLLPTRTQGLPRAVPTSPGSLLGLCLPGSCSCPKCMGALSFPRTGAGPSGQLPCPRAYCMVPSQLGITCKPDRVHLVTFPGYG